MRIKPGLGTVAVLVSVCCTVAFAMACSFSPAKYVSRNACEFLNCDVLFFVDDILPLSGGPVGDAGADPPEEDGGGGH